MHKKAFKNPQFAMVDPVERFQSYGYHPYFQYFTHSRNSDLRDECARLFTCHSLHFETKSQFCWRIELSQHSQLLQQRVLLEN